MKHAPSAQSIFSEQGPHWFSIPSGRSFLDDLAKGLFEELGDTLSSAQILTPTRRGARSIAQSFSQLSGGGALLLPQIRAIGDLDEGEPPFDLDYLDLDLPPSVSSLRRRFELSRLVTQHYSPIDGGVISARASLELADSLGGFFDSLALEEIDAHDKLSALVHDEGKSAYILDSYAQHWQVSARFLEIAIDEWPKRLKQLGLMDPSTRMVSLIRKLSDQWRENPPKAPIFLVGSTGTAPAMADLMAVVARAPKGCVVLPGLDQSLADDAWSLIEESHPQGAMKRLLQRHGLDRKDIRLWPVSNDVNTSARARRRLINEALRPAEATKDWLAQIATLKAEGEAGLEAGLAGLSLINCAHDEEAASVIALMMRETLETPDKTVALITPDTSLARRVSARLTRWGLSADSSAGQALSHSLSGRFLLDILALINDPCDMVRTQSFFKHPYCLMGADEKALNDIEIKGLRGSKPLNLNEVVDRLVQYPIAQGLMRDYVDSYNQFWPSLTPESTLGSGIDLAQFVINLCQFAQIHSTQTQPNFKNHTLWTGADGASASALMSQLITEGKWFGVSSYLEASEIVAQLIRKTTVRTGGNTHPRLFILGAIEARLVKADRLILAGLEEGVWPQSAPLDPFLSRPMRTQLGLPSPERRIGLSAHDFVQAACAPDVIMVTRMRKDAEPRVASRWLWRLQTLCKGASDAQNEIKVASRQDVLNWARVMDDVISTPPQSLNMAPRPMPAPPVAVRPKRLSVTQVQTFVRDPYAIYAKHVLNLKPLDRAHEPFEARQKGTAIHKACEDFAAKGVELGAHGEAEFKRLVEDAFVQQNLPPAQCALQRPFLGDMAHNFIAFEAERHRYNPKILVEQKGALSLNIAGEDFVLSCKADRVEIRDNGIDIIDFKTGQASSNKQVLSGKDPQLTLTAAIIRHGEFSGIEKSDKSIGDMSYVFVKATPQKPRVIKSKDQTSNDLADEALRRFTKQLEAYAKPDKGYVSWRAPNKNISGDYDHLARLYEWSVLGGDDDESVDEDEDA